MTIDLQSAWGLIQSGGVPALLFLIVVIGGFALYKEWFVTGPTLRREIARADREAERADRMEQLAFRGTGLLEEQTKIAQQVAMSQPNARRRSAERPR